eukprot:4258171-Pyramimonas_sp.AAC.1
MWGLPPTQETPYAAPEHFAPTQINPSQEQLRGPQSYIDHDGKMCFKGKGKAIKERSRSPPAGEPAHVCQGLADDA